MGYHVKIEELLEVQNQMISQLSEWGTQLETVYQALETIVVTPCIQGETGKSIQNYIQEVHIPVIGSLQQLLTEFQVRLSVYAEGYYGIDSSYEAEIPQEILEEQQQVLENGREDFENLREEINSVISSVSDIVSVVQPSGLALVLSYQLMESRVKTLNSDIGDYEETHQNDTQNMDSMMESIRSILIARTGSSAVSVTNYQAGSIAMLPAYQRLQMGYEESGNFVAQNMAQYEEAMKKFEDKMNDKLADDRKAEGLKQLLAGIVSATVGTALIFATAGAAAPIVLGGAIVGGTSTLYGLSNATEGMNNISLGFSGDGFTMAENPIRDTLFAGNPDLYYTIGNASTMISAMALPMSGILKGATGAAKFKTIAVDGGRILIGNVAEDKAYDAIYQSTDSRILAMLGSNVVEGVLSGNLANSSVSEIGDVARKVDIEELGDSITINSNQGRLDVLKSNVQTSQKIFTEIPFDKTGKLKSSIKYQTGEFNYNYETGELGRISNWNTENLQLTQREKRLNHVAKTPGKLKGDHAGHLAGDRFGGSPKLDNMVSQSQHVNLSDYRKIENIWAQAIKQGKEVAVNVEVRYDKNGLRPTEFIVEYIIDGDATIQNIFN